MKTKTPFNKSNTESFFFVRDNMILLQDLAWSSGNSKADALLQTSLGYITYGESDLKRGILSCFEYKCGRLVAHRYPKWGSKDFSRDQLTMALCALNLNGDFFEMNRIIDDIPFKISDKFRLTVGMWVWMQSLRKDNRFLATLFSFMSIISTLTTNGLNKLIYKVFGIEQCSPEEQVNYPYRQQTKKEEIAFKLHFPAYAKHLLAWQIYTTPKNPLKKILQKIALKGVPEWNLVVRLLLGDTITKEEVSEYKPMTGYPWQNIVVKELYNMAEIIEYHWLYSNKYNSNENVLDNDVLHYLVQNNLEKVL